MDGAMKRARASATLILHPPDMSLVFLLIVDPPSASAPDGLNPRPTRIVQARVSKVEGSSSSCLSYKSMRSSDSGPSSPRIPSIISSRRATS